MVNLDKDPKRCVSLRLNSEQFDVVFRKCVVISISILYMFFFCCFDYVNKVSIFRYGSVTLDTLQLTRTPWHSVQPRNACTRINKQDVDNT